MPSFDPRTVAVQRVDTHLPKVPAQSLQTQALIQRFQMQRAWVPEHLSEPRFVQREAVAAAVLIPLVMRAQMMVLFTERTAQLSTHSGQIAFPGGKVDAQDADPTATALRETYEEVGIAREFLQVLGHLPQYTTGSAFVVTPVVALVQQGFEIKANPDEVADVFEVPLAFLMDPSNHQHQAIDWQGARRQWISMPYPDAHQERFIWGATAAMLRNFYRFLLD